MTDDRSAALLGEIALEAGMERTSSMNRAKGQAICGSVGR